MPRMVLPPPSGFRYCRTFRIGRGTNTACASASGAFSNALTHRNIVPTLALNGSVCQQYPRVCEAAVAAGWEFMGHGFVQMPMHSLEDQRGAIRRTVEAITAFTGRSPRGWESPGLTETLDTADLLAAEGIEYVADWVLDDQPCRNRHQIRTDRLGTLHRRNERRFHDGGRAACFGRVVEARTCGNSSGCIRKARRSRGSCPSASIRILRACRIGSDTLRSF